MKNTIDASLLSSKSNTNFLVASISLVTSSVMANLANVFNSKSTVMYIICTCVMVIASLMTFIMTVKGFGLFEKLCMLDDKNVNYFLGRKLKRLSIITIFIPVICTLVISFIFVLTSQYESMENLTDADITAKNNLLAIAAVFSILMMILDITLPYIIYLFKIHKSSGGDNFALLVSIIMIVQIVIGSLNAIYSVRGADASFLASFSVVLDVAEGLALMLYFIRKQNKSAAITE